MSNYLHFISFYFALLVLTVSADYYWKDYTGKVPEDAFVAGKDVNGNPTYVGSVYVDEIGIMPTTIYSDKKTVPVLKGKLNDPQLSYVQILCTNDVEKLQWLQANKTDFYFITKDKHVVRGGIRNGHSLEIGRLYHQGEYIIGAIYSGRAPFNDALMLYVHKDEVEEAFSYEVLVLKIEPQSNCSENIGINSDKELDEE